ncbi:hypothetical protein [Sphingomonas sp. S2-65]|uniref:hypothetical protein n=1 Tax=Sphingomonas sp. S2-65 TaxID=2903960 RepID=UPI001F43BFC6|nr:hypothetical protein [Sphingomonas sp. S2-65]UYY57058.1 hypothetical protein LZ586_10200 [Sphingomonas sp. S2-65]
MRGIWRIRQMLARSRLRRATHAAMRAVEAFPSNRGGVRHGLPGALVVNVTSHRARYSSLHLTLRSLLDQSLLADRTILWLAPGDLATLPDESRALTAHGLEIRLCEELRSYKKLVPALEAFPLAFHVTADDDVYYPTDWLAGLVRGYEAGDPAIIAWRAHMLHFREDGRLAPYTDWEAATSRIVAGKDGRLFPTGVGGILYPPASLHPDVLDRCAFTRFCPEGDDIWFFWMAQRQGSNHRRVDGWLDLVEWPGTQEAGLRVGNISGGNDRQIRAMETEFGLLTPPSGSGTTRKDIIGQSAASGRESGLHDISRVTRRVPD